MPVQPCTSDGKPGYQYGNEGYCYTYTLNNEESRREAKYKAYLQGAAIAASQNEEIHE